MDYNDVVDALGEEETEDGLEEAVEEAGSGENDEDADDEDDGSGDMKLGDEEEYE